MTKTRIVACILALTFAASSGHGKQLTRGGVARRLGSCRARRERAKSMEHGLLRCYRQDSFRQPLLGGRFAVAKAAPAQSFSPKGTRGGTLEHQGNPGQQRCAVVLNGLPARPPIQSTDCDTAGNVTSVEQWEHRPLRPTCWVW